MSNAIEGIIHLESPVKRGRYRCTKEPAKVGGVFIAAGAIVTALIDASNGSSAISEQQDTFNIMRNTNQHLCFGQGIQNCLGASLARQEVSIALTRLFARFPNLRLQSQQDPQFSTRRRVFNTFTESRRIFFSCTSGPLVPHEQLLLASLLQASYEIRSEQLLLEQLHYNLLFRWFVELSPAGVKATCDS